MRDAYQLRSLNCRHKTTENLTMKTTAFALLAMAATATASLDLTPDNWDAETAGKTVFIKFLAPW